MSARTSGAPLWLMRPVVNDVIDESRVSLFAGTIEQMAHEIVRRHLATGLRHAAREVRHPAGQ